MTTATSTSYQKQIKTFKLEQAGLAAGLDITLPIFKQAYVMKTVNPSSVQYQAEFDAAKATLDAILNDATKLSNSVKSAKDSLDVVIQSLDSKNNKLKKSIQSTSTQLSNSLNSDNAMIPRYDDYVLKVNGNYARITFQLMLLISVIFVMYRLSKSDKPPQDTYQDYGVNNMDFGISNTMQNVVNSLSSKSIE